MLSFGHPDPERVFPLLPPRWPGGLSPAINHGKSWYGRRPWPATFRRGSRDVEAAVVVLSSVDLSRLIMATAKRDAAAFEQLYAGSCAKVYGVVLRILRRHDMAADVMEESYAQIWQDAEQFNPSQVSPMAWLVSIARRRAIDRARDPDVAMSDGEPEIADAESPGALPRREMTEGL